jgi:general secretion pathway protein A
MMDYKAYFGLERDVFSSDIAPGDILPTRSLQGVLDRFYYTIRLGGIALVTGEIGSGKSTAIRYMSHQLHPSEYRIFHVIACSGSILELYRQITQALCVNRSSNSKAFLTNLIKKEIQDLSVTQKIKPVLIIDEASLLRLEVFSEMHTLCQFAQDSKLYLPIILAGHSSLIDKLGYRDSAPLASRVIARSHLEGLETDELRTYLDHHLKLAGVDIPLFDTSAVTAIHQASGGVLRRSNHLARGALVAAAHSQTKMVTAEHVRLAETELL